MKKSVLRNYAKLIASVGVNVAPGQDVFIRAALDQPEFVCMLTEECYRLGARKVVVDWTCQPLSRLHYRFRSRKTLGSLDSYELERWKYYAENFPCRIYLESDDPDGLKGVNQEKIAKSQQDLFPVIKPYRDAMENHYPWCIAAVPGKAWAKKLFPGMHPARAEERLWEAILTASRAEEGTDAAEAWRAHNRDLKAHCAYLNGLGIESLHYEASNGTDLTVGMIPEARFCGGAETSIEGHVFEPNIPSEECFISPMRGRAEGIVYATKPLCYQGQLIENFRIRFEDGKAVEWHAEKNEALLTKLIGMDEGSAYLGECALVPFSSPINRSGILFYNTLFDENAVCHLALGMGFPDTIEGFEHRSLEEIHRLGVNDSMIHEDFMIGSPDLKITAKCRDGKEVILFRDGEWA